MVAHIYNPSLLKEEAGGWIQGHPWCYNKFEASLACRSFCLKTGEKEKKKTKKKTLGLILKNVKIELSFDLSGYSNPISGYTPDRMESSFLGNFASTRTLFTVAQKSKRLTGISVNKGMNKMRQMCTLEPSSVLRRRVTIDATTQTKLASTSRFRGRGRKDRGFMLPFARDSQSNS